MPCRSPFLVAACQFLAVVGLAGGTGAYALDHVVWKHDGRQSTADGQLLTRTQDGGMYLQGTDGSLLGIPADELVKHTTDEEPFAPLDRAELSKRLLAELPAGFEIYTTQNYLICHNTSKAYAQWCGALFEQLYRAFTNYWLRKGLDLEKPEFPLVAIVFADKASYTAHASKEVGDAVATIIGYYSQQTNRVTMYDLTGVEAQRQPGDRRTTAAQINEMLARPESERTVATIVHEATHQLAFNCGLETRCADIPLWVSEGVAMYFETPDLQKQNGWNNIGGVNRYQLAALRDFVRRREAGSLKTLLADDSRLQTSRLALDAYAESWALNYFLIRQRPKQYLEYIKLLSKKPRFGRDDPTIRLREFQQIFGENLQQLDTEFLRYMSKVR